MACTDSSYCHSGVKYDTINLVVMVAGMVETIGAGHVYLKYPYTQAKGCDIKLFPTITQLIQARETIRLLVPYFKKYRQRLFWGILALLTVDLLQLYIPRVIKQAVNTLQLGQATSASLPGQGLILSVAIGVAFFRFTWRYLVLGFSRLLECDLRNLLMSRLVRLDRPFFNRHPAGEIMALSGNTGPGSHAGTGPSRVMRT